MKLSHLRDVLAVAELGSLRAASRHVGIAQPAITRSIREIEHELGAPLFERHSKGVRLTAIGEAFVRRATVIESELRRIRDETEHLKGQHTGQVSVALSIAPSIALMPGALTAFRKRYPDALLKMSETLFQPIERDIIDGRIDFYVGALDIPPRAPQLTIEKLFDNTRVVIGRKGHKLLEATSLEALKSARWVRLSLSDRSSEAGVNDMLGSVGLPPAQIVMHSRSAFQTVLAIASSDLLTVVPRQWLELPMLSDRLAALPMIKPMVGAPTCLVRQSGVPLTPIAEYLYDVIHRQAENYRRAKLPAG